MYEEYYNEQDAAKRKDILDTIIPEKGEEETLEQMKALFEARYSPKRKIGYIDHFIRVFLEFKMMWDSLGATLSRKKREQQVRDGVHTLCLDQQDRYSREVLFQEMCHVTKVYVSLSQEDKNYNSVIWGLGKISNDKQQRRIESDLRRVLDVAERNPDQEEPLAVLNEAIEHVREELF